MTDVRGRSRTRVGGVVAGLINYVGPMSERPRFHAQDHGRDNILYDPQVMPIQDARGLAEAPSLAREGVALVAHDTAVKNFRDPDEVARVYLAEVEALVRAATGAGQAVVLPGGGFVRYAERSPWFGSGMNTQPARFPHIDFTRKTAPGIGDASRFGAEHAAALRPGQRLVGYNVWRVISEPPQDVPLAICDARSIGMEDLVVADGVYDDGDPSTWWTSEAYLLAHNRRHRWLYFSEMRPDEALIFRAYDNAPHERPATAHSAFDDPACPPEAPGRVSVEARAFAIFDD